MGSSCESLFLSEAVFSGHLWSRGLGPAGSLFLSSVTASLGDTGLQSPHVFRKLGSADPNWEEFGSEWAIQEVPIYQVICIIQHEY